VSQLLVRCLSGHRFAGAACKFNSPVSHWSGAACCSCGFWERESPLSRLATCAPRTRAHFTPKHWPLCHLDFHYPEFDYEASAAVRSGRACVAGMRPGAWASEGGARHLGG
jgi:hypothetical protein